MSKPRLLVSSLNVDDTACCHVVLAVGLADIGLIMPPSKLGCTL